MHKTACVFGGTGFIGTEIVRELCRAGYRVKVASRVPERAFDLKPCGSVGQVTAIACNGAQDQIDHAIAGCDVVINLVGILYEKGKNRFQVIHVDWPERIARACQAHNVDRLVHLSALGVDRASSHYARTKKQGEEAVRRFMPNAIILRPGLVFGPGDQLFNRFARLAQFLPALPLIGGGKTRFQPVYVGDVADAVMAALRRAESPGKTYELGGPDILSLKDIYQKIFAITHQRCAMVPVPWPLAMLQGAILGLLPHPPLTADQVESLKTDNVVQEGAPGLKDLGITPTALDAVLPTYLRQYRVGGRFADKKQA